MNDVEVVREKGRRSQPPSSSNSLIFPRKSSGLLICATPIPGKPTKMTCASSAGSSGSRAQRHFAPSLAPM